MVRSRPSPTWPVLKKYDRDHLVRIALPLGGIGTGTVSLGGRGDLRDWEIMNRPAKGYVPGRLPGAPGFLLHARPAGGPSVTRLLEGPLDLSEYEGPMGSRSPNHGLPRFRECAFAAAYPLGQVLLSDPAVPLRVRLEAFNPLIPGDADASGIPVAILRYVLANPTGRAVTASVCGSVPNFIGDDGADALGRANRNRFRKTGSIRGIFMDSRGVDPKAASWGTMALATTASGRVTHRTAWRKAGWGTQALDFWDDFSADGELEPRSAAGQDRPTASLAVKVVIPPRASRAVTFLISWRFPNRYTWTPAGGDGGPRESDRIRNYYADRYRDAWHVASDVADRLGTLEAKTVEFVRSFCGSDLPDEVKEAALFNLSTLRTQTCFRTPDGRFYGFEGYGDRSGCCHGSCTHVWNYEQATAFLFGDLARSMREVEFAHATREDGRMSFRVNLPLDRARDYGRAAADGQMGCVMKLYRDWQLSGDGGMLRALYPKARKALEFCWIPGGWDGDRDGVMEGCQHNTMDVEYFGPNPQMGIWYLGALRAAEEMARYLDDREFATRCRDLFERGSRWIDRHLFNGEYYEHEIRPPIRASRIHASLRPKLGARELREPEYQLGSGCLVDQLVGQLMAHVCGLGHLIRPARVRKTLRSILKYNRREGLEGHYNCLRSFALGPESGLLMASYPKGRLKNPFPYFTEVMTGFEYAAAIGMIYEDMTGEGLRCIRDIRNRYDGRRRNPFDEAECGHHYARAMASWAAPLALTGFRYSAVDRSMAFLPRTGCFFWSSGGSWGTCTISRAVAGYRIRLRVSFGILRLSRFILSGYGHREFGRVPRLREGRSRVFRVTPDRLPEDAQEASGRTRRRGIG